MIKNSCIYLFMILYICCNESLFAMDGYSERSFCYYTEPILKPAKPAPKTKKPALLFEYFGLTERFGEQSAINVKQLVVQRLLNARPQWQKKTKVCYQNAYVANYSADGNVLAMRGNGDTLCLADQAGRICATKKYSSNIVDVVCHPTEASFIVACADQTLDKIDMRGKTQKTVGAGCMPAACAVNAKTNELAVVTADGILKIWSLAGGKMPSEMRLDVQGVNDLAFHEDGNLLAIAANLNVQIIERSTGTIHRLNQKIASDIKGIAFKPCGKVLLVVSAHGFLTMWEPRVADKAKKSNWKCKQRILFDLFIKRASSLIDMVKFHPQGHLLATTQRFCDNIKLWDIEGNNLAIIPHGFHWKSLIFHPTMHELAVGTHGNLVEIWQQEQFPTLEQLLFKLILKQYLVKCIAARKKPGYPASFSSDKFIDWMSDWFYVEKETLNKTWRTFPSPKQLAIMRTYIEHAKKIGEMEESITRWQRDAELYRKREQEKEQQKNK